MRLRGEHGYVPSGIYRAGPGPPMVVAVEVPPVGTMKEDVWEVNKGFCDEDAPDKSCCTLRLGSIFWGLFFKFTRFPYMAERVDGYYASTSRLCLWVFVPL